MVCPVPCLNEGEGVQAKQRRSWLGKSLSRHWGNLLTACGALPRCSIAPSEQTDVYRWPASWLQYGRLWRSPRESAERCGNGSFCVGLFGLWVGDTRDDEEGCWHCTWN